MTSDSRVPLFEFESADSLAQFTMLMIPLVSGGIVALLSSQWLSWKALGIAALLFLLLVAGLRVSIAVCADRVRIVRKWLFVPYRT